MSQLVGSVLLVVEPELTAASAIPDASVVSTVMMSSTPRVDAAAEIAGLEARRDRVGDDDLRQRVGQRAFEAVADLDAHLALVRRDQQQHAVVLLRFSPSFQMRKSSIGVGLDVLAFSDGTVATTSWMPDLSSSSASFVSIALRASAGQMSA